MERHGRIPTVSGAGSDEALLGRWLASQHSSAASGSMSRARRAVLDRAVPGWMPPLESAWLDRARACSDFVIGRGRMPSLVGPRTERALAFWLETQRAVYAAGAMPAEMGQWLAEHLPGWSPASRV